MDQDHTPPNPPLDLEAHGAFVRALAAHLLGRSEHAQDVAQDTLLAAVQSNAVAQVAATSRKAWLSKIVARKAFRWKRLERTRRDREQEYGRRDLERRAVPNPASESVRGETIRIVTQAVLSLEEPYLQTVLMRFYEDKSPQQIAEKMGVPIATVRSRLQRAKTQLQNKLESEFGGSNETMSLALFPLLMPRSSGVATASAGAALIGKTTMSLKAKTVVAGVGLASCLGWYATGFEGLSAPSESPSAESALEQELNPFEASTQGGSVSGLPTPGESGRKAVSQASPSPPNQVLPDEAPTAGLIGRVMYQGQPLAGVEVSPYGVSVARLRDFRTGERVVGRIQPIDRTIRNGQPGYQTYSATPVDPAVDGSLPEDVRLYAMGQPASVVTTDANGQFTFEQIPTQPFALSMRHGGQDLALLSDPFLPTSVELWDVGEFELQRAVTLVGSLAFDHALSLEGHTTTIEGLPGYTATSDADGNFELRSIPPGEYLLRVDLGAGVYRPDWNQGFWVRLGADPERSVTLATESLPCSMLSLQVTHNGEPYASESIDLLVRGTEQSCSIALDENGSGRGTVPRHVPLQPTARFGNFSDGVSIAEDLYLTRPEHSARLDIQSGSLELQVPYVCVPTLDTCLVSVQAHIEGATAVRFDPVLGAAGHPVALDDAGFAEIRVPAWLSVQPCFQNARGVWVHVETLDVMFPSGTSPFEMAWDKQRGGISLSGHDPELRKETKQRAPAYRLQLEWANPTTQGLETEAKILPLGRLAALPDSFETLRFPGLPVGALELSIHLQRKAADWITIRTWKEIIEVEPGAATVQALKR